VPEGVKGWSWGGFFLTLIWGVQNRVNISLLAVIPISNVVMPFVLGAKGREWAWKKAHWESIEEFQQVQHEWSIVALIVLSLVFFLGIASIIFNAAV
jgi:hypothetical protein